MKVLLIRHTHAVDGDDGIDDEARWLTEKGRALARQIGARLRDDEIEPEEIVASPLVRAVQTAELVARGLKHGGVVAVVPELAPDGSVRRAAADIEARGAFVAAVGHEPGISALAAYLVGRGVASFRKGQALLVDDGRVVYTLDPDAL
jgi:phosphohistidine phosphatase